MPINILKAHVTPFKEAIAELANTIRVKTRLYYDTRKVELFYSTPAQLEIMDECFEWAEPGAMEIRNPQVNLFVKLKHPCAETEFNFSIPFDFDHLYGAKRMFWPKTMGRLRPGFDEVVYADFMERVSYLAQQRMGCLLLCEVGNYLVGGTFKTWDQVAYLFPAVLPIMRGIDKDFRAIANQLEGKKLNVQIPFIEVPMRQKMMHVNEFWATHVLLDTVHSRSRLPPATNLHIDLRPITLDFDTFDFSIS